MEIILEICDSNKYMQLQYTRKFKKYIQYIIFNFEWTLFSNLL